MKTIQFNDMERYYFYIDFENNQRGPLSIDQLIKEDITFSTLVWHEELPSWVEAGTIEEITTKLREEQERRKNVTPPPTPERSAPLFEPYKKTSCNAKPTITQPKTWLVESILVTLFCFLPTGIVSLIYSLMSNDAWNNKEYDKSQTYSKRAGLWIKITIIAIIVLTILFIAILLTTSLLPLYMLEDL